MEFQSLQFYKLKNSLTRNLANLKNLHESIKNMTETKESYLDMIFKTIKENEQFFQTDEDLKKIYTEIELLKL